MKKYDASIEPDFIGTFSSAQFKTAFSLRPFFLVGAGIRLVFRLLFKVVLNYCGKSPKRQLSQREIIKQKLKIYKVVLLNERTISSRNSRNNNRKGKNLVNVSTIIGEPMNIDGGITIIPVSKVTYGFASGGSDFLQDK